MAALALKNSCARRIYCMPLAQNPWISTPQPQTRHPLPTNLNRSDPTPWFFGLAAKPRPHCFRLYTRQFLRPLPIFRSKAAQVRAQSSQTWFSASAVSSTTERVLNFTKRYRERTGRDPTGAARENLRCRAPSGRGGSHRGTKSGQGARLPRFRYNLLGPKRRSFL